MSENILSSVEATSSTMPEPVVPNIEAPVASHNKFPIFSVLLLIVLSIVSVITVYLFLQVRELSMSQPAPSPSPSPLTSSNQTSDWALFEHPTSRYSFRHPATIAASVDKDSKANTLLSLTDNQLEVIGGIEIKEISTTPQEWLNLEIKNGMTLSKQESKTINNISGLKIRGSNALDYYAFIFSKNNMIYIISLNIMNDDTEQLFDQILSTFKFTDTAQPSSSKPPLSKLQYSIPSGWTKVSDPTGHFSIAYDPSVSQLLEAGVEGLNLTLKSVNDNGIGHTSYFGVQLHQYDGGSKHSFIYKYLNNGKTPQKQDLSSTYSEKEYIYEGKNCLFLNGIYISQFPSVWGMCDAGGGNAFLITSYEPDSKIYLQTAQTLKFTP